MGERKVLNKYFPPDFDPKLLPKRQFGDKNNQCTVRIMLPMSVQCKNCGEYIYKGKKFNGKRESADGFHYLGIRVFRFYFRCPVCISEIVFRTDPKNADYVVEGGALRNFEPWRMDDAANEMTLKEKMDQEKGDIMKQLENRTDASKKEMDIVNALEEVYELNQRNAHLDTEKLIDVHIIKSREEQLRKQDEEDEKAAKEAFANRVQRLNDTDDASPSRQTGEEADNSAKDGDGEISDEELAEFEKARRAKDGSSSSSSAGQSSSSSSKDATTRAGAGAGSATKSASSKSAKATSVTVSAASSASSETASPATSFFGTSFAALKQQQQDAKATAASTASTAKAPSNSSSGSSSSSTPSAVGTVVVIKKKRKAEGAAADAGKSKDKKAKIESSKPAVAPAAAAKP